MIVKMKLDLPAEAAYVSLCRNLAETLLRDMGVVEEDVDDVELIVGEVCANAVKHAYDNPEERYEVELAFSKSQVLVTVRDHGRGADPAMFHKDPLELREGGRGMLLVQALADRFEFRVENGTTVNAAVDLHYRSADLEARAAALERNDAELNVGARL